MINSMDLLYFRYNWIRMEWYHWYWTMKHGGFHGVSVGIQLTIYPLFWFIGCVSKCGICSPNGSILIGDRNVHGLKGNPKNSDKPRQILQMCRILVTSGVPGVPCWRGRCRLPSPSWILWWAYGPRMPLTSRKRSPWSSLQARTAPFRMDRFDHSHYMFSLIMMNWY